MNIKFPPYTVGIDNVSAETKLASGAVRDAVNVDFDSEGRVLRRPGMVRIAAGNAHSLWRSDRTWQTFVVINDELRVLTATGSNYVAPATSPVTYSDLLDRIVFSTMSDIHQIMPNGAVVPLGVEDMGLGSVVPAAAGGLDAGRYGVAASFVRGTEEGALSPMIFVDVPDGGGIEFQSIPFPIDGTITGVRLYRTTPDGEMLYWVADIPAGLMSYTLGAGNVGAPPETQYLRRMVPGKFVRYWRGRLLVARGRTVLVSEPMRYGLYSPRHGFIQEPHPITMLRPVEGGIYVGTRAGIVFYRGSAPGQWERLRLGAAPAIPGSDISAPASIFDPRFELGATTEVAFWLSVKGFAIGTAEGQVIQPHERRISLAAQRGSTAIIGHQAVSIVQ